MWSWIETALFYLVGMGLLLWLGGISAAGDALSSWGRSTAERRRAAACSSC
jgi:hypothetical protein